MGRDFIESLMRLWLNMGGGEDYGLSFDDAMQLFDASYVPAEMPFPIALDARGVPVRIGDWVTWYDMEYEGTTSFVVNGIRKDGGELYLTDAVGIGYLLGWCYKEEVE